MSLSQVVHALQLKEVRREVELSRRRSIKLKAQVDKLQESREGQGWSQHRERVNRLLNACLHNLASLLRFLTPVLLLCQVTEEVLSILRLLSPLTEPDSRSVQPPPGGEKQLDATLAQLQNVARQLAISNTKQVNVHPLSNKVSSSYHIASHHCRLGAGLFYRAFPGGVCECLLFTFLPKKPHSVLLFNALLKEISD